MNRKAVLRHWQGLGRAKNSRGWDQAPPFLLLLVPIPDTEPTERRGTASCALSSPRAASKSQSRSSLLPGRGRSQRWECSGVLPALLSVQGGVVVMVEERPLSLCPGTLLSLPGTRSFSERDEQLRLHLFNIHTGRELAGPFCFSWISIKCCPARFHIYISYIYIYIKS